MTLEVINELTEDVKNIESNITPELQSEENTSEISTETLLSKFIFSTEDLDIIDRIKEFKIAYESLKTEIKISKKQALEVFTMLPDIIDTSVKSKLTEAPSIVNKNLFNSTIDSLQNKIDKKIEDTMDKLNDFNKFYIEIRNNKLIPLINIVTDFITRNESKINNILFNETKYLVIYNDRTYNLLTDTIEEICNIDDTKILYSPFENKLTSLLLLLKNELNKEENVYILDTNNSSNLKTLFKNLFKINEIITNIIQYFDNKLYNIENKEVGIEFNNKINALQKIVTFYSNLLQDNNIFIIIENILELFRD